MSDYRFGGDYKLSIYPKDAIDDWGEIDMDKVESVEIEWVDFIRKPDDKTRWAELFGTPERAARTLQEFELDHLNWCHGTDGCEKCPYEFDRYGCYLPDGFELLEWLKEEK